MIDSLLLAGALIVNPIHIDWDTAAWNNLCDSVWRGDNLDSISNVQVWRPTIPDRPITEKPSKPGVYKYTLAIDTVYILAGKTEKGEQLYRQRVDTTETWEPYQHDYWGDIDPIEFR